MLKKILVLLCIILFDYNVGYYCVYASAQVNDSNIKNPNIYDILDENILNEESITRSNCISSIMKLIGVSEDDAYIFENSYFEYPIFSDVRDHEVGNGYMLVAGYANIAVGEEKGDEFYFYPSRNVSIEECIAFIVRCLDKSVLNIDETYLYAKEIGLVKKTDEFYQNRKWSISVSDFCVLLNRMLYEKRGMYFENGQMLYNDIDTKRYIDCLH